MPESLQRRGVADFAEDGGASGAGGAGQIRGPAAQSFVGEQGEREGLLGIARQAQRFRSGHLNSGEGGGELREDQRIAGAAAGNKQLGDWTSY